MLSRAYPIHRPKGGGRGYASGDEDALTRVSRTSGLRSVYAVLDRGHIVVKQIT